MSTYQIGNKIQKQRLNTRFQGSTEHNDLSFDNFLDSELTGPNNGTSPGVDNVFHSIELYSQRSTKRYQKEKQNFKQKYDDNSQKLLEDRKNVNKRIEQVLLKNKQKSKKQSVIVNEKVLVLNEKSNKKESKYMQLQIEEMQQQIEKERKKFYSLNGVNVQLNAKIKSLQNQAYFLKEESKKALKDRDEAITKMKSLEKKCQKLEENVEQVEKMLRIKEKQVKKMVQLQQQNTAGYLQMFKQKQEEIEKLRIQISKKNQQIYQLCQQSEKLSSQNQTFAKQQSELTQKLSQVQTTYQDEIDSKVEILEKINLVVDQSLHIMLEHLEEKQQKTKYSKYQNIKREIERKYRSNEKIIQIDDGYLKKYMETVMNVLDKYRNYEQKKASQIKNFQTTYSHQVEDLSVKMNLVVQQNKHLKQMLYEYKTQQRIPPPQIIVNKIPEIPQKMVPQPQNRFDPEQFRNFMSCARAHHMKIRSEVTNHDTVKVLEEVEKARRIYNDASFHSKSQQKQENCVQGCSSQSNLFRRQRKSLSWKKPPNVLREYL